MRSGAGRGREIARAENPDRRDVLADNPAGTQGRILGRQATTGERAADSVVCAGGGIFNVLALRDNARADWEEMGHLRLLPRDAEYRRADEGPMAREGEAMTVREHHAYRRFEDEFLRLAGTFLACRLEVMGGIVECYDVRPDPDLQFSLLGMVDYSHEMRLVCQEALQGLRGVPDGVKRHPPP